MAFFREAFTKEKKEALNYDDNAALFFAATLLLLVIVPWTFIFLRNLLLPVKSRAARALFAINSPGSSMKSCPCSACTASLASKRREATSLKNRLHHGTLIPQIVILAILGFVFYKLVCQLSTVSEIKAFEPYEILNIKSGTDEKGIRKAYRRMSLIHHPDRHPTDPLASAKFILITKAYQALSDETARQNYDRYGNPDGPGLLEVGIGLPQFLVDEEHQAFFLALFMLIVIIGIPFAFILHYQQQKNFYPNGIRVETIQFLGFYMSESTHFKRATELFAASAESREMTLRESDQAAIDAIASKLNDLPKKSQFPSPLVPRNTFLLLGHMHRLWDLMTPELRKDLHVLLSLAPAVTQSMIEIAFLRNWYPVIRAALELRRCLVQAILPTSPVLTQAPHYHQFSSALKKQYGAHLLQLTEDILAPKCLNAMTPDVEKRLATLKDLLPEQRADLEAFCSSLPRLNVEAKLFVQGEEELVEGDLVTLRATITRLNLPALATAGPVHAPYFKDLKFEEWWLFVLDQRTGGLVMYKRSLCPDAHFVEDLQFVLSSKGQCHYQLIVMCDSYAGLDVVQDINVKVFSAQEVVRDITVHPEDEALDDAPSVFQQVLGQIDNENESSDGE